MVVEIEMEAYNANTSPLFTSTHGSSSPLFTRNSNMHRDHDKLSSNTDEGFLKKHTDEGQPTAGCSLHARCPCALPPSQGPRPVREVLPPPHALANWPPLRMARAAALPAGRDGARRGHGRRQRQLSRSCSGARLFMCEGGSRAGRHHISRAPRS
jgi:hypothetical protein